MTNDEGPARFRVLVLGAANAARSQIAAALLAWKGAGRIEVTSAGTLPAARVHPTAVHVLRAHGIEWSEHRPRALATVGERPFDLVITLGDEARDATINTPVARAQVHWDLPDPSRFEDPAARRRAFEATYETLERRVDALLALSLETLSDAALGALAGHGKGAGLAGRTVLDSWGRAWQCAAGLGAMRGAREDAARHVVLHCESGGLYAAVTVPPEWESLSDDELRARLDEVLARRRPRV